MANKPLRILLVEDTDDVRHITTRMLQRTGYEVEPVDSSAAAIAKWRASAFDVIVTDVAMPGGIDGLALSLHFKALDPHSHCRYEWLRL